MKKTLLLLGWMHCAMSVFGQVNSSVWLGGINEFPGVSGYGNYVMRFETDGTVKVTPKALQMNFEATMAVALDAQGEILFYTNGCHIATASGDTMPNGSGLNPGTLADMACPNAGYIAPKGALCLQQPGKPHLYYLFHTGARYTPEQNIRYGPLYYSVVDMSQNNGKGAVTSKNNIVFEGLLEPFSAVRHGNGRDWWIVMPEYGTNGYQKLLFSPQGVQVLEKQLIGDSLGCRYMGSTVFSLDGQRFGRVQNCRLQVLDFDRCTGKFSHPIGLRAAPKSFGGGGIAFTNEGNKVLINNQVTIFEADLQAATPKLDTVVPTVQLYGVSQGLMQYDNHGRIQIGTLGREKNYHTILNPEGGKGAKNFVKKNLKMDYYQVKTLPNFPNFNLFDWPNSPCDTLGISGSADLNPAVLNLYPNPATREVYWDLPPDFEGQLLVYDMTGKMINEENTIPVRGSICVDKWPSGVYLFHFRHLNGRFLAQRIIKE